MTDISRIINPDRDNVEVTVNNLDEVIAMAQATKRMVKTARRNGEPLPLGAMHDALGIIHGAAANVENEFDIFI